MASCKVPIYFLSFIALSIIILPSNAQNAAQDYVNSHNSARSLVGVAGITWSTTLAAYAQTYANQRKVDCSLVASGGPYGENIITSSLSTLTGVEAVQQWVNQKPYYNHVTNACDPTTQQCRRFTQVVWSASVSLGCARVQCNNGNYYVICSYDPPGNVVNGWPY